MRYLSTRGGMAPTLFSDILLEGLAPDGGLAIPETYPQVGAAELDSWRALPYAELAFAVMRKFCDDIPDADLHDILARTYTAAVFGDAAITPLKTLEPGLHLLGLSNGPTLAFKDIAMQFLGNVFEYLLARQGRELNILGATSGDTGSAAEYAMRGKHGIRVFMLSPLGKMSAFQTAQMFSLQDANIFNIAVRGVFDDCQDMVKAVSADAGFKARQKIGTVNSINWARVVAQVVYYFKGYFAATGSNREQVDFAVPSGNFGNICAGHIARSMGLPIRHLVCATNENDVLDEFFRSGVYRVRKSAETLHTSSPSMDISKASNFERFVFDLFGRDPARVRELWRQVDVAGGFDISGTPEFAGLRARFGFLSGRSTHADRLQTIRAAAARYDIVIDTHTADGLKVALEHREAGVPMIVLETALPAKFSETIVTALGHEPPRPAGFENIEALPQRFEVMDADAAAVKAYIAARTDPVPDSDPKPRLLSVAEALDFLLAAVTPVAAVEQIDTLDAQGRILAADQTSLLDVPPMDNTYMDGYAVRAADCASGSARLSVAQRIPAGHIGVALEPGTAARIFTGASIPPGADAVVMQEQCDYDAASNMVTVRHAPPAGEWVRRAGEDIRAGNVILTAGTRLRAQELGLAASVGLATLPVTRRLRVAVFFTGDELTMPGEALKPGAIYNSNRFLLRGLLQSMGCEVTDLGIVPDTLAATRATLRQVASGHDCIVTSGGVSVGEEDHIKPAVEAEGRLNLWQISAKPGKPLAFGQVGEALFLGLPGNPVSSFVTFLLFVRPVLLRLAGVVNVAPRVYTLRADFDWPRPDRRQEYLRARLNERGGLDLFPNQGSAVLTSTTWGDGLVENPPAHAIASGDMVRFLPFADLLT